MLKQLDTLIGFVVVMSVVSLLITIITQMVSSLLGLRGKHLADALVVMIDKIDPQLDATTRANLAIGILTRPVISDSMLSMSEKIWDKVPLLSWLRSRWKIASAIRPDELLEILKDISGMTSAQAKARMDALYSATVQPDQFIELLKDLAGSPGLTLEPQRLQALLQRAREACVAAHQAVESAMAAPGNVAARVAMLQAKVAAMQAATQVLPGRIAAMRVLAALHVTTAATDAAIVALNAQLPILARVAQADAKSLIAQLNDASNIALENLEKWFNSAQDRAQQWFAINARMITVLASFVAAFTLQLDTFQLIKNISSDPDVRAKLVASADALQKQSEKVIHDTDGDRVEAPLHNEVITNLCKQYRGITNNLTALADFPSLAAAEKWISKRLTDYPRLESFTNDYHQFLTLKRLGASQGTIDKVVGEYQKTGLELLPNPYPFNSTWPKPHWYWFFNGQWSWPWTHLLGILFSSALLSLGGPFWFNTLKSLTNLRPALANEVDKDPKQLPSKPVS